MFVIYLHKHLIMANHKIPNQEKKVGMTLSISRQVQRDFKKWCEDNETYPSSVISKLMVMCINKEFSLDE